MKVCVLCNETLPAARGALDRVRRAAKALGVSQSLLTLRFREFAGGTVMDALIDARIAQAKRLLATTKRPIREVTVASGFRNPNYMKGVFRRKVGMSMREWRSLHSTCK